MTAAPASTISLREQELLKHMSTHGIAFLSFLAAAFIYCATDEQWADGVKQSVESAILYKEGKLPS